MIKKDHKTLTSVHLDGIGTKILLLIEDFQFFQHLQHLFFIFLIIRTHADTKNTNPFLRCNPVSFLYKVSYLLIIFDLPGHRIQENVFQIQNVFPLFLAFQLSSQPSQYITHFVDFQRFDQKIYSTKLHRTFRIKEFRAGTCNHNFAGYPSFLQCLDHLESIHLRHPDIRKYHIRCEIIPYQFFGQRKTFCPVGRTPHDLYIRLFLFQTL